jgi:formylglycine-generating enzyme required for sulfatase activity
MSWRTATFSLVILSGVGCHKASPRPAAQELPIITTRGGIEMVRVPAGAFAMGSRRGKEDASAVHTVRVDSFLMDRYEVTQAEYERLGTKEAFANPSHFKGPTLPVEQVTWAQAAFYCNARSRDEGLEPCYDEKSGECNFQAAGYRLPTEAEWEYACRAGTDADYSFGNDPRKLGEYAWFADNSSKKTHPVGQKKPNPWGLFDMHGNVAEWCNDAYEPSYYQNSPADNPRGPAEGKEYVLRGGAWKSGGEMLRSSHRIAENPGFSDACLARDAIGFRCVRRAPDQ